MAKTKLSLAIFFLFLMLLSLILRSSVTTNVKTWCVAKHSASNHSLIANLEYACGVNPEECTQLKEDHPCFNPDTTIHHASFAMNAYYQGMGNHQWNCDFKDSGLIALTDPSYVDCTYSGGDIVLDLSTSEKWCVAKPMTSDDMLQANIDFACNHVDCGLIRYGGGCYYPNTLINHASVIMNLYYQANGRKDMSCYFKNTGCIVMKDPSYDECKYKF
ncbi:hypothetical protein ACB098_10G086700 [Castanea mollissima]